MRYVLALTLLAILTSPLAAQSTKTTEVLASEVTTVSKFSPDSNYGSSTDAALESHNDTAAFIFMRFAGVADIPGEIVNARIRIVTRYVVSNEPSGETIVVSDPLYGGWQEHEATWNNTIVAETINPPSLPHLGDVENVSENDTAYVLEGAQLTQQMEEWRTGVKPIEFGLLLHHDSFGHYSEIYIDSNFSAAIEDRPRLIVEYEDPDASGDDSVCGISPLADSGTSAGWVATLLALLAMFGFARRRA